MEVGKTLRSTLYSGQIEREKTDSNMGLGQQGQTERARTGNLLSDERKLAGRLRSRERRRNPTGKSAGIAPGAKSR